MRRSRSYVRSDSPSQAVTHMHISYDNFEHILLEKIVIITLSKRNHSKKESAYTDDSLLRV
jgi:hypothetical protein